MPRTLNAEMVQLSPSKDAVIHGPGATRIVEGRATFGLDDREMKKLVSAWLVYEAGRRERDPVEFVAELLAPKPRPGSPRTR